MESFPKLFPQDLIEPVFNLYRTADNQITQYGKTTDRHSPSSIGHFLVSSFTNSEFQFVWDSIQPTLTNYELVYSRILKYTKGCYISDHIDIQSEDQQSADHSLIVQLNSLDQFVGGMPTVGEKTLLLDPGDGILYHHGERHSVTPVRKGVRYVINLRLKKVKY